jgi:choline dehydrogenase-like flavoprotein
MSSNRKEFDIVVVGSGAGLSGIAMPAACNGLRVCLIEVNSLLVVLTVRLMHTTSGRALGRNVSESRLHSQVSCVSPPPGGRC